MKKISFILYILMAITIMSCFHPVPQKAILNKEITDNKGTKMLLGACTRERLQEAPYGEWFNKNYADYSIDTITANQLRPHLKNKKILLFMGTWCGDSRREIPRMFKIFDYCNIRGSQIKLILLDKADSFYKQSPDHEERGLNIHHVPDMLVFAGNKEIGRIVESPVVSLEKDLLSIITDQNYEPKYRAVSFLIRQFELKAISLQEPNLPVLTQQIKPLVKNNYELNTYGYVLMAAGQMDQAGIVFRLNTNLYPTDANAFSSLAEYYLKSGDKILARENCLKTLALDPENADAKKILQTAQ